MTFLRQTHTIVQEANLPDFCYLQVPHVCEVVSFMTNTVTTHACLIAVTLINSTCQLEHF